MKPLVSIKKIQAGQSLLHTGSFGIEDSISPDGLRVRIRGHGGMEFVSVSKNTQDFFRVVADGREPDPLLFESRDCACAGPAALCRTVTSPLSGRREEPFVCSFQLSSVCTRQLAASRKSRSLLADRRVNDINSIEAILIVLIESFPDGSPCLPGRLPMPAAMP